MRGIEIRILANEDSRINSGRNHIDKMRCEKRSQTDCVQQWPDLVNVLCCVVLCCVLCCDVM